jgi:hypothetical protein
MVICEKCNETIDCCNDNKYYNCNNRKITCYCDTCFLNERISMRIDVTFILNHTLNCKGKFFKMSKKERDAFIISVKL